jgi:clathrin heavy chain
MLMPWLEARRQEGSEDKELHNALGMVYVETNSNPQHFLMNNPFYDSKVVGKFCESRDPHLAFIAYRKAWGECDDELLDVTNKNGFFRDQARYLVERQDLALWAKVLNQENRYKRSLIDQVVASALPESRIPEEVSCTVKAFMEAGLPNELMELLERIVLHGPSDGEFRRNKNLQNLLILTAIKSDSSRVMDYLNRLDNYDGLDIAKIARADQYKLYEEAFFIYKKMEDFENAITVLLFEIKDISRAVEYANYADKPKVWGLLGRAQLNNGETANAIKSFMKADDPAMFDLVIASANRDRLWTELIAFLKMARSKIKDSFIDNELLYAYAKVNDLAGLEDFLNVPNIAKVEEVGNRVFDETLYEAARILFEWVKNYAKLAVCYVHLQQYQSAVDAARKANNIATWKAVCYACVDAQEFRLAQQCGVHIIVFMDHLADLVHHYEVGGYFDQVIGLLEQGINLERAHQGIYTFLGICYAKYKEEKLMEHIKLFWSKVNIPTLLTSCREQMQWKEAIQLLIKYDQFESAADTMIEHSSECWEHDLFKQVVRSTPNSEVFYRAANFYLSEHPLLLNDLLIELSTKLDHSRTVNLVRRAGHLPLVQKYLLWVQKEDNKEVNEAVNQLFVDEEDYKNLRVSIDTYLKFDQIGLAQKLQKHALLEMRRISAYLYKLSKRWDVSIQISKDDSYYSDVIATAAESQDESIAEGVLSYFIQKDRKECFAASLYACYSTIRADVVLELAWRHSLTDVVMPFMIQVFRDYNDKIKALEDKFSAQERAAEEEEEKQKQKEEAEAEKAAQILGIPTLAHPINMPLALPAAPSMMGGYPGGGGYGVPPMGYGVPPPGNPYGGGFF